MNNLNEFSIDNLYAQSTFFNLSKIEVLQVHMPWSPPPAAAKYKRLGIKLKYTYTSTTFHYSILTAYRIHGLIFLNMHLLTFMRVWYLIACGPYFIVIIIAAFTAVVNTYLGTWVVKFQIQLPSINGHAFSVYTLWKQEQIFTESCILVRLAIFCILWSH